MRIAIVGVGAVGGYFGGRLAQAGEEVAFVARGATLDALRERGLVVDSIAGDFVIEPVRASDDAATFGTVDAVLFGVKAWQVEQAARSALPLFGAETFAVPLQNGVEAPELLASVVGRERVLGGLCKIFAQIEAPGHITHLGVEPSIDFGELDGRSSARAERLLNAFERAGVKARVRADIAVGMWEKLMMIVPTSAVGAATRVKLGELREIAESRALVAGSMQEIWHLARARGVAVRDEAVERTLSFIDGLPYETTASMQRDIMAGRRSELEAQSGAVVRLANEAGVEVPINRFLYATLLPAEHKASA